MYTKYSCTSIPQIGVASFLIMNRQIINKQLNKKREKQSMCLSQIADETSESFSDEPLPCVFARIPLKLQGRSFRGD